MFGGGFCPSDLDAFVAASSTSRTAGGSSSGCSVVVLPQYCNPKRPSYGPTIGPRPFTGPTIGPGQPTEYRPTPLNPDYPATFGVLFDLYGGLGRNLTQKLEVTSGITVILENPISLRPLPDTPRLFEAFDMPTNQRTVIAFEEGIPGFVKGVNPGTLRRVSSGLGFALWKSVRSVSKPIKLLKKGE